jgi:hypothetical protein
VPATEKLHFLWDCIPFHPIFTAKQALGPFVSSILLLTRKPCWLNYFFRITNEETEAQRASHDWKCTKDRVQVEKTEFPGPWAYRAKLLTSAWSHSTFMSQVQLQT